MHEEFGGHKDGKPVQRALALSSDLVTMPMPVLMMMTKPNSSASFQEPVISTSTIAAKMMPLNSVNTLARTRYLNRTRGGCFHHSIGHFRYAAPLLWG